LRCTENALQKAVTHGGKIILPADCTIRLSADLPPIGANLNIQGNGALIDGMGKYQIFSSSGVLDITLDYLTLRNGKGKNGGAIGTEKGNITVTNSTFEGNVADNGGALFSASGQILIKHGRFVQNKATDKFGRGGAISTFNGGITVADSVFEKNTATYRGG